jgi:glycosyltransferase involved in cell wall biosynthesis
MLLEAAAPLLRENKLLLDIFGDGPMMPALQDYVQREQLTDHVKFHGWIEHEALQDFMRCNQIFAFPSIREFGGGVVLEAMALGLVPLIVDYAGPAELVTAETGVKVPLGSRDEIIAAFRSKLSEMSDDPKPLVAMARNGIERVRSFFTWEKKADQLLSIYKWAIDTTKEKPQFLFEDLK